MKNARRLALLVLALAVLATMLPGAAAAGTSSTVELPLLGQIGGMPNDIVADGRYAYIAIGPRVQVIDLLDPAHPVLVAQTPILPDEVSNLALQDGILYAAVTPGVFIFDVGQPAAINQISFLPQSNPGEPVLDVQVRGHFVYVATGQGLRVLDVADPTSPAPVGLLPGVVGRYLAAAPGEGKPVYVGGSYELYVVSVADPRQPALAAQFVLSPSSYITAIAALDDFAYVGYSYLGSSKGSLAVVDTSTPSAPKQVGSASPDGYIGALTPAPGLLYASIIGRGLVQFDISDPANPLAAAERPLPSGPVAAAVVGPANASGTMRIAAADRLQGLVVFDSTGKGNLNQTAALDLPGLCADLAVTGDVAVCASDANAGPRIFDLSNPYAPRQTQVLRLSSSATHVAASGKRVYVAGVQDMRMHTYEIGPDLTLIELGWTNQSAYPRAMAARENFVYTLDDRYFAILDATTPASARYIARYRIDDQVGFVVSDSRAYVWNGSGVTILDISDPTDVTSLGQINVPVDKIAAEGCQLFIATENNLQGYDVTDPARPLKVSETEMPDAPSDMTVSGRYLYVSYLFHGTQVFRIAWAESPKLVAGAKLAGMPVQLEVQSGKLVVAGSAGLLVYQGMQEKLFLPLVLR